MASPGRAPATLRCRPDGLASRLGGPPEGGCVPILGFQLACGGWTKFPAQLSCDKGGRGLGVKTAEFQRLRTRRARDEVGLVPWPLEERYGLDSCFLPTLLEKCS